MPKRLPLPEDLSDQHQTGLRPARTLILHPATESDAGVDRTDRGRLDEATGLVVAIDLILAGAEIVPVRRARPSTLFGEGKIDELKSRIEAEDIGLVVVNAPLTPVQQRNLERTWGCKVIDRTGLILEIFGARARTREGRMQVELAALSYQRSRLVRSWTHLERQRGGLGFVGGPGESQLELDRRRIDERMTRLRRDLDTVKRTRGLHRAARARVPYPVVALVGYTNAGKSTLFNHLTGAHVDARDQVFATLDPTMRVIILPSGRRVILSDTVGFVADLPTDLVAAFRATLEEVATADVVIHVRNAAHPEWEAQRDDVHGVLENLDLDAVAREDHVLEFWNQIDRMDPARRDELHRASAVRSGTTVGSALTGEGIDDLLGAIDLRIGAGQDVLDLDLAPEDGAGLAWLYRHGTVLERAQANGRVHLKVALRAAERARLDHQFPLLGGAAGAPKILSGDC